MSVIASVLIFTGLALYCTARLIKRVRSGGPANSSSCLAALCALALPVVAGILNTQGTDQSYSGFGTLLFLLPAGWLLAVTGLGLAFVAFSRSESRTWLSVTGLIVNGVIALGPLALLAQ